MNTPAARPHRQTVPPPAQAVQRIGLRVRGVVQGVGFRPFVYRLARQHGLHGQVCNDGHGVFIELRGPAAAIDAFGVQLREQAPPRARIDSLTVVPPSDGGDRDDSDHRDGTAGFVIQPSRLDPARTALASDSAVCADCLAELFEPTNRRWRHPFINCTQCGPRYTLMRRLPYDRAHTSMAGFVPCAACAAEYGDPADRRFHAEANACPQCGPQLRFQSAHPADAARLPRDPIAAALASLARGDILALKGLGGFQLLCDARNAEAVARLRNRKQRATKPFALMLANLPSVGQWAVPSAAEQQWLDDPARPIVLCPRNSASQHGLCGVAPGLAWLGLMLPCAPLHYLLFHEAAGRPAGSAWLAQPQALTLVCTSANAHGAPLITDNDIALHALRGIADSWLLHDRDIVHRADDSLLYGLADDVATTADRPAVLIRRARGFAPDAIRLGRSGPPVLAFGAHLKNTLCVLRDDEAFLSPHIGDLDHPDTCRAHQRAVADWLAALAIAPQAVAHELHPDTPATHAAWQWAQQHGVPAVAVQHHHAHLAAVLAEHHHTGPALGLALDGVGLGDDGTLWGGELLQLDGAHYQRLGHLMPLPLPGGDAAAREPWRMAAAVLHALGRGEEIAPRFAAERHADAMPSLLARGTHCPPSTSLGRYFDAAAALLGVCRHNGYEGEAAMRLESLTCASGHTAVLRDGWRVHDSDQRLQLDVLPLFDTLHTERDPARGAIRFHDTLAAALLDWTLHAVVRSGVRSVALAGGCLLNRRLARALRHGLQAHGLTVLSATQAPPNDGGIALGQAHVARLRLEQGL